MSPPKASRRPDHPVTNTDINNSNTHLNSLFPANTKSWMHGATSNNPRGASTAQQPNTQSPIIQSDVRSNPPKRSRGRPRKYPTPPVAPAPSVPLPSPALTNEPSPANSHRHVTPQNDVPPIMGAQYSPLVTGESGRGLQITPVTRNEGTTQDGGQHNIENTENQPEGSDVQHLAPASTFIAESMQPRGSKRDRELSHEAEDALAGVGQKRLRVDMSEFELAEHPNYKRVLNKYHESLQNHVEKVGGWEALPRFDEKRYGQLMEACSRLDGFYLVIHQLFCAWTDQRDTVYQLLAPVSAGTVDNAFRDLQHILLPNKDLQESHRTFFASWPRKLDDLEQSHKGVYGRHLPQIKDFLERFVEKWRILLDIVTKRAFPLMARELIHTLGCWSGVMRHVLFTVSRRKLAVKDRHAAQINALRDEDQQCEFKAINGNTSQADLDRNRPNLREQYRLATAHALRQGQFSASSVEPNNSASAPTSFSPAPPPSTLELASTMLAAVNVSQPQSPNAVDLANQPEGQGVMAATSQEKALPTTVRLDVDNSSPQQIVTMETIEQQPSLALAEHPAATLEQHSQIDAAEDLVARLEQSRVENTIATGGSSEQDAADAQTVAARRNMQIPALQNQVSIRPDLGLSSSGPWEQGSAHAGSGSTGIAQATPYQSQMQFYGSPSHVYSPLPSAQTLQSQAQTQQHSTMHQASPNMATQQVRHPGPVNQASPNMMHSQSSQASPRMANSHAPHFQGQPYQGPSASPHAFMHQQIHYGQHSHMSRATNQPPLGLGQGYLAPHFSPPPQIQGNQTPAAGVQMYPPQQQHYMQQFAGMQLPPGQVLSYHQSAQAAVHQQNSPTTSGFRHAVPPTMMQGMGAAPPRGRFQQPGQQATGRVRADPRLLTGPIPYVRSSDVPERPHDMVCNAMTSHLPRLRSPPRLPGKGAIGQYYQYVRHFARVPRKIHPDHGVREITFPITDKVFANIPKRAYDGSRSIVRPYWDQCMRLRLRCCQQAEDADLDESRWVTYPTVWPSELYVRFNGSHLDVPRKRQFKKDLPIDLSDIVKQGDNELKIVIPQKATPTTGTFFFAVEAVWVVSREKASLTVRENLWGRDQMVSKISKRLSSGSDDEIQIESQGGLTISLTDPWTSAMFKLPVRGLNCKHLECLDLDTVLDTRPRRSLGNKTDVEPSDVDAWKCPTCDEDIRPSSLGVDVFMSEVREKLISEGKQSTKAIIAQADGSWVPIDEPDDEDDDGPPPAEGQHSASSDNRPPPEIIEID